jgi:hypothetical protein
MNSTTNYKIEKMYKFNRHKFSLFVFFMFIIISTFPQYNLYGQPESAVASFRLGHVWGGVAANGSTNSFDFTKGFFPNDYYILQYRGQGQDNYFGSGIKLGCTNWISPVGIDSLLPAACFASVNDYQQNGKVVVPLTNYYRYNYSYYDIDDQVSGLAIDGTLNPSLTGGTFDHIADVTYYNVIGANVRRRVMSWSQNFNDDYVIIDMEIQNVGHMVAVPNADSILILDTLYNFYVNMQQTLNNNYYSNTNNPSLSSNAPTYSNTWQHYYGARANDTLRIFYFYPASNPTLSFDDMGAPLLTQTGRLANPNYTYYTILHASLVPYSGTEPAGNDDPLQPKVTYIGVDNRIPKPDVNEDVYNNNVYWSVHGGFSYKYPMSNLPGNPVVTGDSIHHMYNNDELGTSNFANYVAGSSSGTGAGNYCSFGPYNIPPNQKIHIVYAVGFSGMGLIAAKNIGNQWYGKTLTDPSKNGLPPNFQFINNLAIDNSKDKWIGTGLDSVFLSSRRAKWNFDHNYQIPQAPPPPDSVIVNGYGYGVEIRWSDPKAEQMPNFAGYKIMRTYSIQDTVFYQDINYPTSSSDKAAVHVYVDKTILKGGTYFYYIQAMAKIDPTDPNYANADPTTQGKIMYSSRLWVPNIYYTVPPIPPQQNTDSTRINMSKIRIVPNPYNINDPLNQIYFNTTSNRGIEFYNLPGDCTVRIYTENGDFVNEITNPRHSGFLKWDMITINQQVINSGVYIAVFLSPTGGKSFQKFVVVR